MLVSLFESSLKKPFCMSKTIKATFRIVLAILILFGIHFLIRNWHLFSNYA